jgi:nitroreductase
MEVFEAIRTLLAVRRFQDSAIPEASVRRIIEAAWLTGSSMNAQPWHFIAVQDPAMLKQMGALAGSGPYIAESKLAVVVVTDLTKYALSDASRAVQSMALAAWGDGIGSNWVGFGNVEWVKSLLGIPPELDVLAIVPFGYPANRIGRGKKKRKPLGEVASRERFGQPFA